MATADKAGADKAPQPIEWATVIVAKGRTIGVHPNEHHEGEEVQVAASAVKLLVADGFATLKKD